MSFEAQLQVGRLGESKIAQWLIGRGFNVLPAYEIEISHGKGPRVFTAEGGIISPDLLAFNRKKTVWIEAKHKSAFTWHRRTSTWQTGIDRRHWLEYLRVAGLVDWPVWILFLHEPGCAAKDTPPGMVSPSGLFGNDIRKLRQSVDHEHENWGPSGMVYWKMGDLIRLE